MLHLSRKSIFIVLAVLSFAINILFIVKIFNLKQIVAVTKFRLSGYSYVTTRLIKTKTKVSIDEIAKDADLVGVPPFKGNGFILDTVPGRNYGIKFTYDKQNYLTGIGRG